MIPNGAHGDGSLTLWGSCPHSVTMIPTGSHGDDSMTLRASCHHFVDVMQTGSHGDGRITRVAMVMTASHSWGSANLTGLP